MARDEAPTESFMIIVVSVTAFLVYLSRPCLDTLKLSLLAHAAHRPLKPERYLPVQHGPHQAVQSAVCNKVVNIHGTALSNAVSTVFSLLDVSRVPVQLCKDHVTGSRER